MADASGIERVSCLEFITKTFKHSVGAERLNLTVKFERLAEKKKKRKQERKAL